jgi:uncharacterized damage-inducible protein DinB
MELNKAVFKLLTQITEAVKQLEDSQYAEPLPILSQSSIGQHVRHVIEMYECLLDGYEAGIVNYELRKRQKSLETLKDAAIKRIEELINKIGNLEDKTLELELNFDEKSTDFTRLNSNFYRELAFNIEHTIHHMALLKIGLKEIGTNSIHPNFGIASSTVKFRTQCAQ